MAGLRVPLSTLRQKPYDRYRMTRGRGGWLGLPRTTLAFATPCRSPGALSVRPIAWRIDGRSEGPAADNGRGQETGGPPPADASSAAAARAACQWCSATTILPLRVASSGNVTERQALIGGVPRRAAPSRDRSSRSVAALM